MLDDKTKHAATNPDYPDIDTTLLPIPEHLKQFTRINGKYLLVDGRYGSDLYDQLQFWVDWRDKKCKECGAHFKLYMMLQPGVEFDATWDIPNITFAGAYPTCSCPRLGNRTHFNHVQKVPLSKFYKPITPIEERPMLQDARKKRLLEEIAAVAEITEEVPF